MKESFVLISCVALSGPEYSSYHYAALCPPLSILYVLRLSYKTLFLFPSLVWISILLTQDFALSVYATMQYSMNELFGAFKKLLFSDGWINISSSLNITHYSLFYNRSLCNPRPITWMGMLGRKQLVRIFLQSHFYNTNTIRLPKSCLKQGPCYQFI